MYPSRVERDGGFGRGGCRSISLRPTAGAPSINEGGTTRGLLYKGVAVASHYRFFPLPTHLGGFEGGWGCVLQREGDLRTRQAQNDEKKKEDGGFTYHP